MKLIILKSTPPDAITPYLNYVIERDVGSILVDLPNSKEMYSFPGGKVRLMTPEAMFLQSAPPSSSPVSFTPSYGVLANA